MLFQVNLSLTIAIFFIRTYADETPYDDKQDLIATPIFISFRGIKLPSQPTRLVNHSNLVCFRDPPEWNSKLEGTEGFYHNTIRCGFNINTTKTHLCHVSIFRDDQERLIDLISQDVSIYMSINDLELQGKLGIQRTSDQSDFTNSKIHNSQLTDAYVFTHYHFSIFYLHNRITHADLQQQFPVNVYSGDISTTYSISWHHTEQNFTGSSEPSLGTKALHVRTGYYTFEQVNFPVLSLWNIVLSILLLSFILIGNSFQNRFPVVQENDVNTKQSSPSKTPVSLTSHSNILIEELSSLSFASGVLLLICLSGFFLIISLQQNDEYTSLVSYWSTSYVVASAIVGVYFGLSARISRAEKYENMFSVCHCHGWLSPIQRLLVTVSFFPCLIYLLSIGSNIHTIVEDIHVKSLDPFTLIFKVEQVNVQRVLTILLTCIMGYYIGVSKQNRLFQPVLKRVLVALKGELCGARQVGNIRTMIASFIPFGVIAPVLHNAIDTISIQHGINANIWTFCSISAQFFIPVGLVAMLIAKVNNQGDHDVVRIHTTLAGFCIICYSFVYCTIFYLLQDVTNRRYIRDEWESLCIMTTLCTSLCISSYMTIVNVVANAVAKLRMAEKPNDALVQ